MGEEVTSSLGVRARLPGIPGSVADPQLRAEMDAYVLSLVSQAYFGLIYQSYNFV